MPLTRGRSVRFGGLLHRDSFEAGSFGSRPRLLCPGPRPSGAGGILGARAPVAQWIERWVPDPKVAGSSPVGRARTHVLFCFGIPRDRALASSFVTSVSGFVTRLEWQVRVAWGPM